MKITFPTNFEKKHLLLLVKKQNYILFLGMKFAFIHPKIHEIFSQIYFEIRRLNLFKLNLFKNTSPKIPHFMIIGFPKAGTTSLHDYLSQHPKIFSSWIKETHFFSYGYEKGINFYFKFFNFNKKHDSVYFESSPEYIFYFESMKRIKRFNPNIKLIICLRNPIDLAYSSYNEMKNMGLETESFENVLLKENYKMELHKKRMENKIYTLFKRPIYLPYLYIGEYVTYIKNVLEIFDIKNLIFVDAKDLKNYTHETVNEIFQFLDLDNHKIKIELKNTNEYAEKISIDTRKKLLNYFEPYNVELEQLLNKKFNWD